jgi:hypothetical protein
MNSPVFNDPCQAAPPVLEDALGVIKSGVIPDPWNHFFNLIASVKFRILQDSFQHRKDLQVTWACVWRIWWVPKSGDVALPEFRYHIGSIMTH